MLLWLTISFSYLAFVRCAESFSMSYVRIWDLPTRVFHWVLVLCVTGLLITGHLGGDVMAWHFRLGYVVLTLLLFRILWGIVGGHWSRWAQLPISPVRVMAYVQGRYKATDFAGHNPLGSWSVLAFLLVLLLQVSTGLISDDEIANMGPLSPLVSAQWVSWATSWHKSWGKIVLILLICVHLLALTWYHWRKNRSLIPAMWHGDKTLPNAVTPSLDHGRSRGRAFLWLLVSATAVFVLVSWGN
jgi:cytochrome b